MDWVDGLTASVRDHERERAQASGAPARYKVLGELGHGGMGVVYRAWDVQLNRPVALKVLSEAEPDAEARERFLREAQLAAGLNHPNIVAVHDVGLWDGRPFMAMELVEGTTIDRAKLNAHAILRAVEEAARALHAAHRQGVVHRDVKPSNLLIDRQGRVRVSDFGLAKRVSGSAKVTASGMIVGTPAYMPPEQARGLPTDARSDVYALGATLYELTTGRVPFTGRDLVQLLQTVATVEPVPPRRLNAAIPRDVETIILKAMDKSPERRYATALAMAEDVRRHVDGEPILGRRSSIGYRVSRTLARNRGVSLLAAALVLLSTGAVVVLMTQRSRAVREHDRLATYSADERERLKKLSSLWMTIIERKRDLRALTVDADQATDALRTAAANVADFARQNPQLPQGWYLQARAALYLGDDRSAEAHAQEALKRAPDFDLARALLGTIRLERAQALMGTFDEDAGEQDFVALTSEAVAEFRKVRWEALADAGNAWGLTLTSEDEVMRVLAECLHHSFGLRDGDGAVSKLRTAAAARRAEEFAIWIAHLSYNDEQWLQRAVQWAPGFARGWYTLGVAKSDQNKPDEAIAAYDRAVALNRCFPDAHVSRGLARKSKNDLDGAIADYDRAVALDSHHAAAYTNRGIVRRLKGEYDAAIADQDRAIALKPDCANAYGNRGYAKQNKGDFAGSVEDFDRALALREGANWRYLRGSSKSSLGDYDGAIADYDAALALKEDMPNCYSDRGFARRKKGDIEGAIEDYSQAIVLKSDAFEALVNRASAYAAQGRHREALADLDRAVLLRKDSPEAYMNRGHVRAAMGNADGAMADYDQAVVVGETSADAHYARGQAKAHRRDRAGAEADFDRAIALRANFVEAHYDRGLVRQLTANLAGATEDYNRALELRPNHLEARTNRGNVRDAQGDVAGALADWTYVLRIAPPTWPYRSMVEQNVRLRKKD